MSGSKGVTYREIRESEVAAWLVRLLRGAAGPGTLIVAEFESRPVDEPGVTCFRVALGNGRTYVVRVEEEPVGEPR